MKEDMVVSEFMKIVYDLLNDLREINELPSNTVIVHKILKNLPMKYETFVRMLQNEKETPSLASLASRLYMEETKMRLRNEPNEEALGLRIRNVLREKHRQYVGSRSTNFSINTGPRRQFPHQRSVYRPFGERQEINEILYHQCGKPGHIASNCHAQEPTFLNRQQQRVNHVKDQSEELYPTSTEIQNSL